jgi:acyl-CoA synthetase (NDP forming)
MQEDLVAIAREGNIRLLGPNCMGLLNSRQGLVASFTSMLGEGEALHGHISVVSQSGAFASQYLSVLQQRGLGVDLWAATGNQADVDFCDCIAYMAQSPDTRVIAACVEGVPDADKFIQAIELARRNRVPITLLKIGRSEVGREAAATHTAALSGSDEIFNAILRKYGVHRATDIDELFDIAYSCSLGKLPETPDLGLVTTSGGFGIVMADAAEKHGLSVPPLPAATQERLKALIPYASTRNPVDVTGQIVNDAGLLRPTLTTLIREGEFRTVICSIGSAGMMPHLMDRLLPGFEAVAKEFPRHLLMLCMVADQATRAQLEKMGYLVFENPARAVAAAAALQGLARHFARQVQADSANLPASLERPLAGAGVLDEVRSKALLSAVDIPILPERLVSSAAEAGEAAESVGFPCVMKIVSPDILHKSDIGGVALGVADRQEAELAFERITDAVRRAMPGASTDGVLVAPMARDGIELIVGAVNDATFGPAVLLGCGGIFAELFDDKAIAPAPVDRAGALEMINELKAASLLREFRGRPPSDTGALAEIIVNLSRFAAANRQWLASVDINPLMVFADGRGAAALDAVVVVSEQ